MVDKLNEYVRNAKKIVEDDPQMGETNTKTMLIESFIDALGWNFVPSEIKLEYKIQMGTQNKRVDYALMLNKAPSVFVEAKGLDTTLSNRHRKQIRSYMHNEEGVNWGLLTNGKKYEFYMYSGSPSSLLLGEIPLEQLSQDPKTKIVRTLSKKSVEAGESEQIAEKIRDRKNAISTLKDDKDAIAEDVAGVLTDRIGDSLSNTVETEAKEFVDSLVEEMKEDVSNNELKSDEEAEEKIEYSEDISMIKNGNIVKVVKEGSQADEMAEAVNYLIEEESLLEVIPIPYVPGNKKSIVNSEPKHPNGDKMRMNRKLSENYYLDTHMNKSTKEKHIKELAKMCGLKVKFEW